MSAYHRPFMNHSATVKVSRAEKVIVSVIRGRRGMASILDCVLTSLSKHGESSQALTFEEIAKHVSRLRGSPVLGSTVRGVVYAHSTLFSKVAGESVKDIRYRLSEAGQKLVSASR
jgi:hypothetical protein